MTKEEKEFRKEVDTTLTNIYSKINEDEKIFLSRLVNSFNVMCERNLKAIRRIEIDEKIVKEQPSGNELSDKYILDMLDGYLKILEGVEDE